MRIGVGVYHKLGTTNNSEKEFAPKEENLWKKNETNEVLKVEKDLWPNLYIDATPGIEEYIVCQKGILDGNKKVAKYGDMTRMPHLLSMRELL